MFYFYETQTKDQTLKVIGHGNSAGNMRIFIIVFSLLSTSLFGQKDSPGGRDIPSIIEFHKTLGQDIDEISALLLKNNFTISDAAAQEKANKTCCPDINYKEKKFFAKYYSNGQTDIELILRNDNKLYSVKLLFPAKNIQYMQTAENELKTVRFQVIESKRDPKRKTTMKQLRNNGAPTQRAFAYYYGADKPDSFIIDETKLINGK